MSSDHKKALQSAHPGEAKAGQCVGDLPCQRGVPLYPLRYGITDAPYDSGVLSPPEAKHYPQLKDGKAYGLRVMRPGSYVYLFYFKDGRMWTQQYLVMETGLFAPVWWTDADYDAVAPGRLARPHLAGAKSFLLAPPKSVAPVVHLMVSDTVLTHRALWRIEQDIDGTRSLLTVEVKPSAGPGQLHAFDIRNANGQVHEIAEQVRRNQTRHFAWSESQPASPDLSAIIIATFNARSPNFDLIPLAVVLPDLIGVLSELNMLVGARLAELSDYGAQAARKLTVSRLITQLAEDGARQRELEVFNNDDVGSALPAGATGGAANAARDRAYRAGLDLKAKRLGYVYDSQRLAFERDHPAKLATLNQQIEIAATDLGTVFQANVTAFNAIGNTYLDGTTEVDTYLDYRCLFGHTIPGLIHCKAGHDYLSRYVPPDGPTGPLKFAVMGHTDIVKKIGDASKQARGRADAMLKPLQELLARFPADGASQQLSVMMGALVAQGKLPSANAYWTSLYRPLMELLDGDVARLHQVPLDELGAWVRTATGGHGINGFRPSTIQRAATELVEVYDSAPVQEQLAGLRALPGRLRFWHNLKLGVSGVGLFASTYSATITFNALSKQDGQTLANALDAGGKVLGITASSASLTRYSFEKQRDLATARGDKVEAARLKAMAECAERWAIGLAAGAALTIAVKDFWSSWEKEQGTASGISVASGTIQSMAAGVGALQLLGKMKSTVAVELVERMGLSSAAILRGGAYVARLGSGPIGWTLLALELMYVGLRAWHDKVADEQKITTWLTRSVWGNGRTDNWFGEGKVEPYADYAEELREFHRLFQQPSIETDVAVLKVLGAVTPIGTLAHGGRLPEDARAITIALPGWKPQISHYRVTQQHSANFQHPGGQSRTYDDPARVKVVNDVGYVTIQNDTLIGKTEIEYHPNGFTDPDYVLKESNRW